MPKSKKETRISLPDETAELLLADVQNLLLVPLNPQPYFNTFALAGLNRQAVLHHPALPADAWLFEVDRKPVVDRAQWLKACPFGGEGDVICGLEGWAEYHNGPELDYVYRIHGDCQERHTEWRSPDSMPRDAARLWFELTRVRVLQLRDLSSTDITAYGVELLRHMDDSVDEHQEGLTDLEYLADAWRQEHGRWDEGLWVWALDIEKINVPVLAATPA